jgi:hypothetical protein
MTDRQGSTIQGRSATENANFLESLPELIVRLHKIYPDISDNFSPEDLLALFAEFNSYTHDRDMTSTEFKLIMNSLNVD